MYNFDIHYLIGSINRIIMYKIYKIIVGRDIEGLIICITLSPHVHLYLKLHLYNDNSWLYNA